MYFENVFTHTEVFVNPDEKIIVREPEYFDGLQQVLQTLTPQAQGNLLKYNKIHFSKVVFLQLIICTGAQSWLLRMKDPKNWQMLPSNSLENYREQRLPCQGNEYKLYPKYNHKMVIDEYYLSKVEQMCC